ncbi:MAG: hypothetical protein AAFU33_15195, partial [Bacteroidota bacterium]
MEKQAPVYGRFSLPPIEEFITRLQQLAETFMESAAFSSYIITYDQGSFYGLDYVELAQRFNNFTGDIRSLSTSCSGPEQQSINISVRFKQNSEIGDGQYVIVAHNPFDSRQMASMIQGTWQPPSEEELQARQKWIEDQLKAKEEAERAAAAAAEAEKKRKEAQANPPPRPSRSKERSRPARSRPAQTASLPIISVSDVFHFDDEIAVNILTNLLDHLSQEYMRGKLFSIRMITRDGELFYNVGYSGLDKFFSRRRNHILKLLIDGNNDEGEKIQMSLAFGPTARNQNAEIEIYARKAQEIKGVIREALEQPVVAYNSSQSTIVYEMFSFDQKKFSLPRVVNLINRIEDRYLKEGQIMASMKTRSEETFSSLNLDQLSNLYREYRDRISFLLIGSTQSLKGQTFSLMFQFETAEYYPYGSLSMMWGDEQIHKQIRNEIWHSLQLELYTPKEKKKSFIEPLDEEMRVKPIFNRRSFQPKPHSALVIMPLEAYWSESLWGYLQDTLSATGIEASRSEALFSPGHLDDSWSKINEAELLIVDLTYKQPDVFYKIGIAHTLGKRILILSQHTRDLPQ